MKSTVEEIRARFDGDVERFSNLDTGQSATMDAPLCLELIAQAAAAVTPGAKDILDIGCGAGNFTLKLLQTIPDCNCHLIDLSKPMLERAVERVKAATSGAVSARQIDIRAEALPAQSVDVVVAGAVLHHLRSRQEWHDVAANVFNALRPGGSVWIFDMIRHDSPAVQTMMWRRYGSYLTNLKDSAYRDTVFEYIEQEDTPETLDFQLHALRTAGFGLTDVLHKNSIFAAFGAVKL
jgi:tRNA (cmo5U34)-methyltransferase